MLCPEMRPEERASMIEYRYSIKCCRTHSERINRVINTRVLALTGRDEASRSRDRSVARRLLHFPPVWLVFSTRREAWRSNSLPNTGSKLYWLKYTFSLSLAMEDVPE